jgi:hypothetical protein
MLDGPPPRDQGRVPWPGSGSGPYVADRPRRTACRRCPEAPTYHGRVILPADGHATTRSHPWAVAALVAVNLLPLAGVLLLGWRLSDLMLLYWLENGIIGGFTVLKILTSRAPADALGPAHGEVIVPLPHRLGAVGTALFFAVHYGVFWTVHGVFVRLFFGPEPGPFGGPWSGPGWPGGPFGGLPMAAEPLGPAIAGGFGLALLSLVVSHGTSYVVNYLGRGEDRSLSPLALMQQPYGRVIVLHVTILGGGFLAMFLGQPLLSLVLLVALKTAVDVQAHLREHGSVARAGAAGPPSFVR